MRSARRLALVLFAVGLGAAAQEGAVEQKVSTSTVSARTTALGNGWHYVQCTAPTHYRMGATTAVAATTDDLKLPATMAWAVLITRDLPYLAFILESGTGSCSLYPSNSQSVSLPRSRWTSIDGSSVSPSTLSAATLTVAGAPVYGAPTYDVRNYGAVLDGVHDDTAALDAAIAAASPVTGGRVYIPSGTVRITHPVYVHQNVLLEGESKQSVLIVPDATFAGPTFVVGPDHSLDGTGLTFTTAIAGSGTSALQQQGNGSAHRYVDLAQYSRLRLPSGGWTVSFFYKPQDDATGIIKFGDSLLGTPGIGGHGGDKDLSVGGSTRGSFLEISKGVFVANTLDLEFRYNGLTGSYSYSSATYPTLSNGTTYFLEVSWDGSKLRAFINGELWTHGAQTPSAGSDATGFLQLPWEAIAIGNGTPDTVSPGSFGNYNGIGVLDSIHFSDLARHTASYTAPTAKQVADSHTLLLVNFDTRYKDCLVGTNGTASQTVYLRATPSTYTETPGVTLRNFSISAGGGIVSEFASTENIADVYQIYGDGWTFFGNGYFSRFSRIDLSAGTGRIGWAMSNASYIGLEDITVADPVGFYFNGTNGAGHNLTATMHPGAYVGLATGGGTMALSGYQVDAEETTSTPRAALLLNDPLNFTCAACTLYLPATASASWSPVFFNHVAEPTTAALINNYFPLTPGQPLVKDSGTLATFATPLLISNALNASASALSSTAGTVTSADLSSVSSTSSGYIPSTTPTYYPLYTSASALTNGQTVGEQVLPAHPLTVTAFSWRVSSAGSGGTTGLVWKASDGTNTCTATSACNVTGNRRVASVNGTGTGCAFPASASITYTVDATSDCAGYPTVLGLSNVEEKWQ